VAGMFSCAAECFGQIDIAVANAGINLHGPILEARWEDVLRVLQVSQFGVFHTVQFAARQMVQQVQAGSPGGKIVVIGSIHELQAVPGSAAYNMAKAAISHLARTAALELAPYRINVNVVDPGRIDTPSTRAFLDGERLEKANRHIPWGRVGMPEEVGKAVAYLASEDADYVTGSTIVIDGGFSINLDLSLGDEEIWEA
jgi:glucose 1-dehydrogenase